MKALEDMVEMNTALGERSTARGERNTARGESTARGERSTALGETTKESAIAETSPARANMAMKGVTNLGPGITSTEPQHFLLQDTI